jgi:hypothetical protein
MLIFYITPVRPAPPEPKSRTGFSLFSFEFSGVEKIKIVIQAAGTIESHSRSWLCDLCDRCSTLYPGAARETPQA